MSRVENKDLQEKIREFYRLSEEKYAEIGNGNIKDGTVRKVKMYEEPLVAVGSAKDPLFEAYKNPEAIGPWHYMPEEWLPGAKSVISLFFPMTEEVKRSNWNGEKEPSEEWLYCRIEGHAFIQNMAGKVKQYLEENPACRCWMQGFEHIWVHVRVRECRMWCLEVIGQNDTLLICADRELLAFPAELSREKESPEGLSVF